MLRCECAPLPWWSSGVVGCLGCACGGWLCGGGAVPGDPWQADHVIPGNPDSPLAPAHRSCNAARGNKV